MEDERYCLRVRNLPAALSSEAVTSLLTHYGAARVRVLPRRNALSSGKEPGTLAVKKTQKAVAVFASRGAQQKAQRRLHALELAGHHLQAEVVGDDKADTFGESTPHNGEGDNVPETRPPPLPKGVPPPLPPDPMPNPLYAPAPLAPHLGLNYAPSPLLEYKYPRATESIVRNIANALIALPRFYTQVLHLMNKMNLPPPFEEDAIPGRFSLSQEQLKPATSLENKQRRLLKRARSENAPAEQIVEEEDDDDNNNDSNSVESHADSLHNNYGHDKEAYRVSKKRQINDMAKEAPLPDSEGSTSREHPVKASVSGAEPTVIGQPFIRHNKRSLAHKTELSGVFQLGGTPSSDDMVHQASRPGVISETELKQRRVSLEDMRKEPLMALYSRGIPSTQILVRNIAKTVDENDLRSVFGHVLPSHVALDAFEISFKSGEDSVLISYSDEKTAVAAVDKIHGVQLEGQPLIVCFQNEATGGSDTAAAMSYWTTQQLASKLMPDSQLSAEKAMKKYERGEASDTLYVKNLAKAANLPDLVAVFGAILPPNSSPEALDIRYFTTGRMKCQAFVKYPTVELASRALQQTHGVVLKGKPMIVCFRKPQTDHK